MLRRGALVGLLATAAAFPALAGDLVVIVHAERDTRLSLSEVGQIYLKKRRFWEDGDRIVPVNRNWESEARQSFVRIVFGEAARHLAATRS